MHTQSSLSEVKISDVLHLARATHRWLIFSDTDIEARESYCCYVGGDRSLPNTENFCGSVRVAGR